MSTFEPTPSPRTVEADPKRPYKAIFAFVVTVVGALAAALAGKDTFDNMSSMEWFIIVAFVIINTGGVYGIRNPKVTV